MATNLYFSRDTRCFIQFRNTTDETGNTAGAGAVWEIPILDGYSFSASTNTSEVTLSEMESTAGVSRRGRKMFTDSIAAAEWSFNSYIRPFKSKLSVTTGTKAADDEADKVHLVDEVLWAHMLGANEYDATDNDNATDFTFLKGATSVTQTSAGLGQLDPSKSNLAALHTFTIYFLIDDATNNEPLLYKLPGAVVNEVSIDFDVEGIATVAWSGQAKEVIDFSGSVHVGTDPTPDDAVTTNDGTTIAAGDIILDTDNALGRAFYLVSGTDATDMTSTQAIDEATTSTNNFIRNRLSSIEIEASNKTIFPGAGSNGIYSLPLTGGNFTFSNNISFLVPEELGSVNKPLEHVTGTRSVSGSATCYLALDTTYTGSGNKGTSRQFFNDLTSTAAMGQVINDFTVVMNVGKDSADENRMEITMGNCHFEVPTHSIEDVISLETSFHALPTDFDTADEVSSIKYDAVATY